MKTEQNTLEKIKGFLYPYHRCVYYSKLTKEEILSRIKKKTEPEQFFRMKGFLASSKETKEFEGTIDLDHFKINKLSKKKKSYAPVVSGRFSRTNQFTKVSLSMRLSYFILAFIPIWILFFVNFFFNTNFSFEKLGDNDFIAWYPIVFLFVFYIILTGSFHYHVSKAKKSLEEIIEPEDTNSSAASGASWIIRN